MDDLATVLRKINGTLTKPTNDMTALELADGLIFSPSDMAIWEADSAGSGDAGLVPLFGIRLGYKKTAHLRAIASRHLPEGIPQQALLDEGFPEGDILDDHPLSKRNQWEIIGQTSVYGLPALRRDIPPLDNPLQRPRANVAVKPVAAPAAPAAPDVQVVRPRPDTPEATLAKVPRINVVRPLADYAYLNEIDGILAGKMEAPKETGIAVASAFQTADVTLTGLGATMRLDWHGEPPSLRPRGDTRLPASFSLERLAYQSWLGRDVRVVAVTKGYLIPFGMRASLLTVAERVFMPDRKSAVAREIVREFIVAPPSPKRFPAVNQPDGGRDFPIAKLSLQTTRTPDLVAHKTREDDALVIDGMSGAFWPRYKDGQGTIADVAWKLLADDDSTPLTCSMIFIDAAAADNPTYLEKVIAEYNRGMREKDPGRRKDWHPRSVVQMAGTRRRYAAQKSVSRSRPLPGVDTAFDTESWLVVARGRGTAAGGAESYIDDARMNSVDQPAFYPSVLRANIAIQSIDRLIGSPQGLVETRLFPEYVTGGFEKRKITNPNNIGEIFLEVVGPTVSLDPAKAKAPATGGIAQPNTNVVALSRVSGVVGGKVGDDRAPVAESFKDAIGGKFNPSNFFDLKILGVDLLKLIDVDGLENAPLLTELIDYGVDDNLLSQTVRPLASAIHGQVVDLHAQIQDGIHNFNRNLQNLSARFSFSTLYPDLSYAYGTGMETIIVQLDAIAKAQKVSAIPTAATRLSSAAKPLIEEIGKAVRDPIPQIISEEIGEIVEQWESLRDLLQNLPGTLTAGLAGMVDTQLAEFERLADDELAVMFGLRKGETFKVLATSSDARRRLAETLLFESLGKPVLAMVDQVARIEAEISGTLRFDMTALEAGLYDAIESAIASLTGSLIDDAGASANVLREDDVRRFAYELAAALADGFRTLAHVPNDTELVSSRLKLVFEELNAGGAASKALTEIIERELQTRKAWLRTIRPSDLAEVQQKFSTRLQMASTALVIDSAKRAVGALQQVVILREAQASETVFLLVAEGLRAPFECVPKLLDLIEISKAARQISGWCTDAAGGVLRMAKAFGDDVLAPQADIDGAIQMIVDAVEKLTPPTGAASQIEEVRKAILVSIEQVKAASLTLANARAQIASLSADGICSDTAAMALSLTQAVKARGDVIAAMRAVSAEVAKLDALFAAAVKGDMTEIGKALISPVARIAAATVKIIAGASLVGSAGKVGPWQAVIEPSKARLEQSIKLDSYLKRLKDSFDRLVAEGQAIRADIAKSKPGDLPAIAARVVALAEVDRRFAGTIVETITLTDAARQRFETVVLNLAKNISQPLALLHKQAGELMGPIADLPNEYPALSFMLGGDLDEFAKDVRDLQRDGKLFGEMAASQDPVEIFRLLKELQTGWDDKPMPLILAIKSLAALVDKILQGQFNKLLADAVRALFNTLEQRLTDIVSQLIPTKVNTSYTWSTDFKSDDVFVMEEKQGSDPDLKIVSKASFDFIDKSRDVRFEGVLQPFRIVVGDFFTVYFHAASFASVNGSSPQLDARVKKVELGKALQFLKTLETIISPGGNGVYVRPEWDSITVGYAFAKDIQQIGSLTLSNIALDVYARLPFGNERAQFGFLFASREKPFLISNPPYGGGGWVAIRAYADKSPDIELSLMFGAVTDIAFGPLKGQGRICAGVEFQSATGRLTAFVQAVGEGSIACFSISIYIGIFLTHYNNGHMIGEARYSFKFKVGFVTLSYGVTARYTIKGGDESNNSKPTQTAFLGSFIPSANAQALAQGQFVRSDVPIKSNEWDRYRKLVSMELLDA